MITNPSCQSETKESEGKFHAPNFEDDLGELGGGGGGQVPPGNLTDLSGYGNFVGQPQPQHQSHYNGHYASGYNWHHQSADYNYYSGAGGQQGYYGVNPPHHYQQTSQYQDQWSGGGPAHQAMVLPPGPSPTGSNNSPSPHGFSDRDEEHHRADLKRPSPDSFVPPGHTALATIHHQHQPVPAKKPKVSKRRKKRDPNEPQKPVSAYALFFRDTQASIKLRNPNANFGEVSKIVAATWDALDPDSKAAYKKRTEMAKKEYLRALAAYRANLVSKGSGHELYGGFPGYSPMLFNGSPMEQAMPATGLGLGPGNISPGSHPNHGMVSQGLPPHYNGSYHPGYMQQQQQNIQVGPHSGHSGHSQLGQPQHSPSSHSSHSPKMESDRLPGADNSCGSWPSDNGHFRPPGSHWYGQAGQQPGPGPAPADPAVPAAPGGQHKCGRVGCRNYSPGHSSYCTSECVVGECKEVYDNWSSCMVKPAPTQGTNPDVMVK